MRWGGSFRCEYRGASEPLILANVRKLSYCMWLFVDGRVIQIIAADLQIDPRGPMWSIRSWYPFDSINPLSALVRDFALPPVNALRYIDLIGDAVCSVVVIVFYRITTRKNRFVRRRIINRSIFSRMSVSYTRIHLAWTSLWRHYVYRAVKCVIIIIIVVMFR